MLNSASLGIFENTTTDCDEQTATKFSPQISAPVNCIDGHDDSMNAVPNDGLNENLLIT
jgi:hypothetical protein